MLEVFVGTQEAQVVFPMAVSQYAFQVDHLTWIQQGPLSDFLFQRGFPTKVTKITSDVLSNVFKETFTKW